MNTVILIIIFLITSTIGLLLLKSGMKSFDIDFQSVLGNFKIVINLKLIVGLLIYIISFLTWIVILARKELSFIYPIIIGLSYIAITCTAIIILHESLSVAKVMAIILICCGIIILIINQ